jgi:hypothetical protein
MNFLIWIHIKKINQSEKSTFVYKKKKKKNKKKRVKDTVKILSKAFSMTDHEFILTWPLITYYLLLNYIMYSVQDYDSPFITASCN